MRLGRLPFAALVALLLTGQVGLMAAAAGLGSLLEAGGHSYASPVFLTATICATFGAIFLTLKS